MSSNPISDDLPSPLLSAFCFVNESVSEWVTFLSSCLPRFFAPFILLLEKKRKDFTVEIKDLKHAGGERVGAGRRKAQMKQPVPNNLPGEVTTLLLYFFFPFLSCPCLCVLIGESHIPSLPLPARTPFGGPSFPAEALGITCDTHICKTNQLWRGQGVPAPALKGSRRPPRPSAWLQRQGRACNAL